MKEPIGGHRAQPEQRREAGLQHAIVLKEGDGARPKRGWHGSDEGFPSRKPSSRRYQVLLRETHHGLVNLDQAGGDVDPGRTVTGHFGTRTARGLLAGMEVEILELMLVPDERLVII
jgi:hypothetical protein